MRFTVEHPVGRPQCSPALYERDGLIEFAAAGTDVAERGALLGEALEVLTLLTDDQSEAMRAFIESTPRNYQEVPR